MARVLFVSTSTTVGGAEKTLFSLATLLDPKRFPVAGVVSLKPFGEYAERLAAAGIRTHTLGLASRPGLKDARALAELIRRERPDIVHALMYQAIQLCRLAKKSLAGEVPFRLISSPRVSYRTRGLFTLALDRWLKRHDDLLIAESEASRERLVRRLGYAPGKVKVIRNGVDLAHWTVSKLERQKKRLELRLGADDVLIGTAGRLDRQKGHDVLIRAMARLTGSHPVRCVILGEGPQRPGLERLIRELSLEKSVWLLGERGDVTSWLSALEVFVLPSRWEGLPNSLLEAMALGLPSVASAVDGVPEALTDGRDGLLVPPDDPAALAGALDRLLGDAALRARLGAAAHAAIAERFTLIRMMESYQAAYEQVLSA